MRYYTIQPLIFVNRPLTIFYQFPPSRSIGILVGYSFRIPTQQLGCCYGIDCWKVAGIFPVSLAFNLYLIIVSSV